MPPRKRPAELRAEKKQNAAAIVALMQERGVASPMPVDADYVMGLYRYKRAYTEETGLRNFIGESRTLFDMKHKVIIPEEYRAIAKEVRTPFYRDTALHVTAALTKDPALIHVTQRDEGVDSEKAAALGTAWSSAQIAEMDHLQNEDVTYKSALNLVCDSESVVKTVHRPDAWANFPVRDVDKESPNQYIRRAARYRKGGVVAPFARRVVDRLQMVFGDGEYGDEWAIEFGAYPRPYLESRYGISEQVAPVTRLGGVPRAEGWQSGNSTIKYEYHDAFQWAVVVDGEMVADFPKPNPYCPLLPYHRAVSYPALYALKYLIPAIDALLTMQQNWAYISAFPIPIMEQIEGYLQQLDNVIGDSGEAAPNQKWSPGKLWTVPNGWRMRFMEPPSAGAELREMIKELREMIDIAGIPNILRGIGGARQAGYSINQLMAAAQVSFKKLAEALERQTESALKFFYHAVDYTVAQDVYVLGESGGRKMWLGLSPSGNKLTEHIAPVDQLGPPNVKFRPVLPTDEQAEAMIAMQVTNAGKPLMSVGTAMVKYLGIEDPVAEEDKMAVDKALEDPTLQADMMQEGRRLAGLPSHPQGIAPEESLGGAGQGGPMEVNDAANAGQPTVMGLTQPLPSAGAINPAGAPDRTPAMPIPGGGGRPAGSFPGQP